VSITLALILTVTAQGNPPAGSTSLRAGIPDSGRPPSTIDTSQSILFRTDPIDRIDLPRDVDGANTDNPLQRHTVYQLQDAPAPGEVLNLPAPRSNDRTASRIFDKPLTLDYIFLGPSSVQDPGTNVTMQQIGIDYRWTRPFFRTQAAFTFRPAAEIMFLAGPGGGIDLPEQLYKIAFDLQLDIPINEFMGVSLGITPGLWSDLIVIDGADFRLPARALLTYRASDSLFLAGGVVYTDNYRRNVLPGIGVIWDPTPQWHLELLFPRSRLLYRWNEDLGVYFVFERGGTTYNIRALGSDEDFEYRDWRTMLGLEYDGFSRASLFVEVGAAFDRLFRLRNQGTFELEACFLLHVGTRF
jgi:hypothetical protein